MSEHKEAFCLMKYRCESCGETEIIWNSRDGVTPFVVDCRLCNGDAVHADWSWDRPATHYQPLVGQRFFRDGTDDEIREIMRRRVNNPEARAQYPLTDEEAEQIIENSVTEREGEFSPGWPMLEEYRGVKP